MKKVVAERLIRVEGFATMSVYEHQRHRVKGKIDPPNASVVQSLDIINEMLTDLQKCGIRPGTKLKIIIETTKK